MTELRYLGHSAFYIKKDNYGILIDPFLSGNPNANFNWRAEKITHIIVTHAHSDHLGDAIPISRASGAKIIAVFELANFCASKGANVIPCGIGGELNFEWGKMKFVPACHTSSNAELSYGGLAAGGLIDIDDTKIYHAGDTALCADIQLLGEYDNPYYALLPVGGCYTMGIADAAVAAKFLYATEIIPMHYNTFPQIRADIDEFKRLIEAQGQKCRVLQPNESIKF